MVKLEAHSGRGQITSFDIAAIAGVSQSTVSGVLSGEASVSSETRQRIIKIAADLGYQAKDLRHPKTNSLAVLVFDNPVVGDPLVHPFYGEMLAAITRAAADDGYDLLITFESQYDEMESYCRGCRKSDGIILLGAGEFHIYQRRLKLMGRLGVHFVRYAPSQEDVSCPVIRCDNFQGGLIAVRHLIALGRQRIVFMGNISTPSFAERFRGYTHALRAADVIPLPPLQVDALSQVESGRSATLGLLARGERFDAIFAASDMIAIGALQALRQAGVAVPETVSVVGFDDIQAASLVRPALTSVQQDTAAAGRVLVDTLLKEISGEHVDGQTMVPKLVVRESCGNGILRVA